MPDWISMPPMMIAVILTKILGMYIALIIFTRIAGLRSFSKMSGFDFAVTVAIGSVFASVILAKDPPLAQGIVALAFMFCVQMSLAELRKRSDTIEQISSNDPRLIMIGDKMLKDQMRAAKISETDLYAKLREANVLCFSQIDAVVAETTGDVSVLHRTANGKPLDPALLEGVLGREMYTSDVNR